MRKLSPFLALLFIYQFTFSQTQPTQPTSGPGSDQPVHSAVTMFDYSSATQHADGFWIFEPAGPTPDSANLVIFCHGWCMTNLKYYGALIDRIVKAGNIVIAPRFQKDYLSDNGTFTDSCARGIQRALDTLKLAGHVKPRLYNCFILGHSMGGVLTANMTTKYQEYNIPKPLAAFSMEPGADLSTLELPDYSGFPADVKYLIVIGDNDAIVDSTAGKKLFAQTTAVPTAHKNLVRQFADSHGSPAITASHAEPGSPNNFYDNGESSFIMTLAGTPLSDAVDFYCYWKLWDALVDCALHGQNCDVAFGDTHAQKYMGEWSDGTPVRPLLVTPASTNTGIEDVSSGNFVQVYPNPVAGSSFQVAISKVEPNTTFSLFDISGKRVSEQKITTENSTIKNNYPAGIYFYEVRNSESGAISKGKLVIQ